MMKQKVIADGDHIEAALILRGMSSIGTNLNNYDSRSPSENSLPPRNGMNPKNINNVALRNLVNQGILNSCGRPMAPHTSNHSPNPASRSIPIQHGFNLPRRVSVLDHFQSDDSATKTTTQQNNIFSSKRSVTPYNSPVLEGGKSFSINRVIIPPSVSLIPNLVSAKREKSKVSLVEISPRTVINDAPTHNRHSSLSRINTAVEERCKKALNKENDRVIRINPLPSPPPLGFNMKAICVLAENTRNVDASSLRSNFTKKPSLSANLSNNARVTNNRLLPSPQKKAIITQIQQHKQQQCRQPHQKVGMKRELDVLNNLMKEQRATKQFRPTKSTNTNHNTQGISLIQQMQIVHNQEQQDLLHRQQQQQQALLQRQQQQQPQAILLNTSTPTQCNEVGNTNKLTFHNQLYILNLFNPPKADSQQTIKERFLPVSSERPSSVSSKRVTMNLSKKVIPERATTISSKAKLCKMVGCSVEADKRSPYCIQHRGQRKCENEGCNKFAQSKTRFCIKHGGGRRCTFPGCTKGARDMYFCGAHGGGRRCTIACCRKLAVGGDNLCTAHGGGRRCMEKGCSKSAQSSSGFCVRHGGGRKCRMDRCQKVARGNSGYCMAHTVQINNTS